MGDFALNCAWDEYGADPTKADPTLDIGWWKMQRLRMRDSELGLLPKYRKLFGSNMFAYLRPGFTPEQMGSTAQAVAYLASSPGARAAHI
jgi:predicted metal-dependent hydrolase